LPTRRRRKERGQIANPTTGKSRNIRNASIRSDADAVAFVRNGGSLDKVPNKYWVAALNGNASDLDVDPQTRFKVIRPDRGAIGVTRIWVLRDADGKPTDQGWVTKGAKMKDTAAEIGSQYLAFKSGFPVEAAGWDGEGRGRQGGVVPFAVLPHALNGVQTGNVETGISPYDAGIFRDLPDKGNPQRVSHYLHNWLLGVADRNTGNGMTYLRGNTPYVIPIDQGWAGRAVTDLPDRYAFTMDSRLFRGGVKNHLDGLQGTQRAEQIRDITRAYDDHLGRAEAVVREGKASFVAATIAGDAPDQRAAAKARLEEVFDVYQQQVGVMRANLTLILQALIPTADYCLI
jgi:hypothetical protein